MLGHADPASTYWYLEAAPGLLTLAAAPPAGAGGAVMTALAPTLQAFFTDRLAAQRQASGRTVAAYRDTLRLLVRFVSDRTSKPPSKTRAWATLTPPQIGAFLDPPGAATPQQHPHPQRPPGSNPLVLPLRGTAAPRARAQSISRVLYPIPHKRYSGALVCFLTPAQKPGR